MKEKKIKLEDESGDRKYFTQIPNMIINHSSAYEQSLYLIMKRIAGEHGSCYASINWLSKKMNVAKKTVNITIDSLINREWIKETEPKSVFGGKVRQFKVIDLWKENMKNHEGGTHVTTFRKGGTRGTGGGTRGTSNNNYNNIYTSSSKKDLEKTKKELSKKLRW